MSKPEQIVSGLFLPISDDTTTKLYKVLESEGYEPNPQGVGLFLSDVARGKLSENPGTTDDASDILSAVGKLAREHGPTFAKAALEAFRAKRG